MKNISKVIMIVAFIGGVQACSNPNPNNRRDNLKPDTMVTPPIDTHNYSLDTATRNGDTLGSKNQKKNNY